MLAEMGFDVERETVRVLEERFTPPTSLARSETAAFARWIHEPFGAVLFIRRWRNDNFDSDLTITCRDRVGQWVEPGFSGGSGAWDPFERPTDGWDGEPVSWGGESGSTVGEEGAEAYVRVFEGMASRAVANLEVFDSQDRLFDQVHVRADTGLVIVGVLGEEPYTVVAKGFDGSVLRDANGVEVHDVFEDRRDPFETLGDRRSESDGPSIGAVLTDGEGRWFIESRQTGRHELTDPEVIERLERGPEPWPRRVTRDT